MFPYIGKLSSLRTKRSITVAVQWLRPLISCYWLLETKWTYWCLSERNPQVTIHYLLSLKSIIGFWIFDHS